MAVPESVCTSLGKWTNLWVTLRVRKSNFWQTFLAVLAINQWKRVKNQLVQTFGYAKKSLRGAHDASKLSKGSRKKCSPNFSNYTVKIVRHMSNLKLWIVHQRSLLFKCWLSFRHLPDNAHPKEKVHKPFLSEQFTFFLENWYHSRCLNSGPLHHSLVCCDNG